MGDPKRQRKKYAIPAHPWEKDRIDGERELNKTYQFGNKKELWKANSLLRTFMREAKRISAKRTEQTAKEEEEILNKLKGLGLLEKEAVLSDILNIKLEQLLERRLQTLVFRKGLAKSAKQARQFIVHGHIALGEKIMTRPSYYVSLAEEQKIKFKPTSNLKNEDHPERSSSETVVEEKTKEEKKEQPAKKKSKSQEKTKKTEDKEDKDDEEK